MASIKFDQKEIQKIEKDFKKIEISSQQREQLNQAAQVYAKNLPLSERAIKGFILYAMRDYQIENKINLADFPSMSKEEKQKVNMSITEKLRSSLTRILLDPKQEPLLDAAIQESLKLASKF